MTEVNKYTNSVTLIMGKRETGVTTHFAKTLAVVASQTLVHVVMGGEEAKQQLLNILKNDFPEDAISGSALPRFVEGTTHLFIGVHYSQGEVFTERDIAYYLSYTRQFIDIGYKHVVMELTLQGDGNFNVDNYPELAAIHVMRVGTNGLYCTTTARLAFVNQPAAEAPAEPEVLVGELVD